MNDMGAWRWLAVLVLVYGVVGGLVGAIWTIASTDQDALFYLGNATIFLVPAVVYALAALLLFSRRRHRATWLILLVCGLALSVLHLVVALREGWGALTVVPLCLTVVALVCVRRAPAGSPTLGDPPPPPRPAVQGSSNTRVEQSGPRHRMEQKARGAGSSRARR